jgi:phenylacetate-coenzyme A ligase PaaK-like adenylate-forming protein
MNFDRLILIEVYLKHNNILNKTGQIICFSAVFTMIQYPSDYNQLSLQMLETALSRISMYRAWSQFDPGPGLSVNDRYAAMPALTKKELREYFPHGVLPPGQNIELAVARGEIELVSTSGTTDDKVTNVWNQKWWNASEMASWKLNSDFDRIATGEHREALLANPRNVGIISDEIDLPLDKRRVSRFLFLNEKTDPTMWTPPFMDRMIADINTFQPVVLEANPTLLAKLCRYIYHSGKAVFQPGMVVFTYEFVSKLHLKQISRVFPVPTASSYGSTETGYVFMQCEKGRFHQNSEYCRVDFQPLKPEQGGLLTGRILVTPFRNPWSMMIRFDTGDMVSLAKDGQCECGRNSGLILASVDGRKVSLTVTDSGRLVTLFQLDNAITALDGLEEYKVVQTDRTGFQVHLVTWRKDKFSLEKDALNILHNIYGSDAQFQITYKDGIPPEVSGKYLISQALFPVDLEQHLVAGDFKDREG